MWLLQALPDPDVWARDAFRILLYVLAVVLPGGLAVMYWMLRSHERHVSRLLSDHAAERHAALQSLTREVAVLGDRLEQNTVATTRLVERIKILGGK